MTYVRFTVLSGSVLLFGCAQPKPQAVIHPVRTFKPAAQAKENTSLPSPPIGNVRNVRESESVKVYGMNRYVDPLDPRVLHERHAIYRVEEPPHWVTQSDGKQNVILLGPILGLRNAQYAPEPLPGETARDLVQTKQRSRYSKRGMKTRTPSSQMIVSWAGPIHQARRMARYQGQ